MKNRVRKAWSKLQAETNNTNPISDADKAIFRPSLVHILPIVSPAIRAQFTSMLSKILIVDYPAQWPEFQDLTMSYLHAHDVGQVFAGLMMFLELTKIYRWKSGDNRAGLEGVVGNVFPIALGIANRLVGESGVAAGTMLVLILKAYKSAIAVSPLNAAAAGLCERVCDR